MLSLNNLSPSTTASATVPIIMQVAGLYFMENRWTCHTSIQNDGLDIEKSGVPSVFHPLVATELRNRLPMDFSIVESEGLWHINYRR